MTDVCNFPLRLCTDTMYYFHFAKACFLLLGNALIGARDLVAVFEWCGGGFHV